ncbi:hypothetical protein CSX12_06695 [Microbacterium sp. Y-01]|uniref:hypothetical protein n=1 Tax=Microbacterium sp. Y-01 TaxID=2048898 RepID=UPI000F5E7BFC|nr:hypothetical protein [Microbacterium sp. Y-01]AZH78173.1 hypothetical protein CSX12_06695 [Microbacterium sp. Y-01]
MTTIKDEAARQAEVRGATGLVFETNEPNFQRGRAKASFRGHPIRVDFTDNESHPAYKYNVDVYDGASGDLIATGNGGRDWSEALSIVHWQNLSIRWADEGETDGE